METHHTPWWPYFLKDQTRFNYFIEILAIGFRGDLQKNVMEITHANWRPFFTDQLIFSYFCRRFYSDNFYKIILNSDYRFHRRF